VKRIKVKVELTELEASALLFAAGNILDAGGDEVLDFYNDAKQDRNAAYRATAKIKSALRKAQ
jgi:hypothetical protein